jgi:hypothetical protein
VGGAGEIKPRLTGWLNGVFHHVEHPNSAQKLHTGSAPSAAVTRELGSLNREPQRRGKSTGFNT